MLALWHCGCSRSLEPSARNKYGVPLAPRQTLVQTLLEDQVVVGFDLSEDFEVLGLNPPPERVRDVQKVLY